MTPSRQERNHPTSSSSSFISPTTTVLSDSETREREDLSGIDSHPVPVSSSHVEEMIERGDPLCSDIPEWLQEFRENLVDDRVPEHRDSHASSSHELSLEPTPTRSEDLGKHSVYTHSPKDRNCDICQRTKITRAPCRRRNGEAVPRAENFGDLITADHKILNDNCESRNNHRLCSRGAGSSHSMDPGVSVQKQNFTRNPEKLAEVPGTREETKSHLH